MKKLIPIIITLVTLTSCAPLDSTYSMSGHVADSDLIVTEDGNAWGISTDIAVGSAVVVTFDDNGTSNNIFDDIITNVVID